jgi:hypothetical protein
MQYLFFLPLLFPLSVSGCLPLYHALRECSLEAGSESAARAPEAPTPEGRNRVNLSAGHDPTVKSIHLCGVCAFIKGMNGAFLVSHHELRPPSLASSALAAFSTATPSWSTLHPVSRAPPTSSHV